jgi:SagB-type dehydrogenase family enzyme
MIMRSKIHTLIVFAVLSIVNLAARDTEVIKLAEPQKTGGLPLFEALNNRKSTRNFSPTRLHPADLSNLLWSAYGINREDGRRTAPSARNIQEIDIYLIMADGWYVYDAENHSLVRKGKDDLRMFAGTQEFVRFAPVNLIYVADHDRMTGYGPEERQFYSAVDVGFISQNVYLFCASEGLNTVVRGLVDREKLRDVLKLGPSQFVILGQTVGYPGI